MLQFPLGSLVEVINMMQETELWEKETSTEADATHEREKDEDATGRDLPRGDGNVGDEQVHGLHGADAGKATGQDHSTDDHERTEPRDGVGAVQDSSLAGTDIADITE
jgi:hypothetical protein